MTKRCIFVATGLAGSVGELKGKLKEWTDCLSDDDRNSIRNQLSEMVGDLALFHVVNSAWKLAPPAPDGGIQVNARLQRLWLRSYACMQQMAIRRLSDQKYGLQGPKGVYSLPALLEDMEVSAPLLTRKNILEADGVVYDYDAVNSLDHFEDRVLSRARHEQWDIVAGVSADDRSPDDQVSAIRFKRWRDEIAGKCKEANDAVDKLLAHASTLDSRAVAEFDPEAVTFRHLREAAILFCKATRYVGLILGREFGAFCADLAQDDFRWLDVPLVRSDRISELRATAHSFWIEFHESTDCGPSRP